MFPLYLEHVQLIFTDKFKIMNKVRISIDQLKFLFSVYPKSRVLALSQNSTTPKYKTMI